MPEPGPIRNEAPREPSAKSTRLKPEAAENMTRLQATNDWFVHDGRTPPSPPTPSRPPSSAHRTQREGDPDQWYSHPHHVNGEADLRGTTPGKKKPANRCSSDEAKKNFAKIKGTKESWYRHDENLEYNERPRSRLTERSAINNKEKIAGRYSVDWYSHDEKQRQTYTPPKPKTRTTTQTAESNATRLRPTGTPGWASYDKPDGGAKVKPPNRLRLQGETDFVSKNRKGNTKEWYKHDHKTEHRVSTPTRITSPEGQMNAAKFKQESSNWFNHDANRNYYDPAPSPRVKSSMAKAMMMKNRGQEDDFLKLEGVTVTNGATTPNGINGNGHMNGNGSPGSPEMARLNLAFTETTISSPETPTKHPRVSSDGAAYAQRNKGTLNVLRLGEQVENGNHGFSSPRIKSPEAHQHMMRERGTIDSLFHPDSRR